MSIRIEQHGDDVLVWIKAVPGASRDGLGGVLGDRLKVRVSAAAESGKANQAICDLLAAALDVRPRRISIEKGRTSAQKVVRVLGAQVDRVRQLEDI